MEDNNTKEFKINLWNLKDIQNFFNCGRNKALKIMQLKSFPSFQIGRTYYVAEDEVYKWIQKNKGNNIYL